MIEGPICQDEVFRHKRNETLYIVMHANMGDVVTETIMKKPDHYSIENGWTSCVIYCNPFEPDKVFVRDEATFRQKFERTTS